MIPLSPLVKKFFYIPKDVILFSCFPNNPKSPTTHHVIFVFRLSVTLISAAWVPSFGSWSSAVCLTCKRRAPDLNMRALCSAAVPPSLPSHKACVSRENCVCVHMCVLRLGWLTATSFAYSRPLPSVLFFSVSLSRLLSLHRHRKSTAERATPTQREREEKRERVAGRSRAGCHASEPSVNLPPFPPDRVLAAGQGLACKPASHISP